MKGVPRSSGSSRRTNLGVTPGPTFMAPAMSAVRLHHSQPLTPTIVTQPKSRTRRVDWGTWVWSFLLALGFTSTFLLPTLRHGAATTTSGTVLGEDVLVPLEVAVTTIALTTSTTVQVQPKTGTIAEALARAADRMNTQFDYASRGNGIYLNSFFNLTNGRGGEWRIVLNGQVLGDLSAPSLSQGDQLVLTWQPQ